MSKYSRFIMIVVGVLAVCLTSTVQADTLYAGWSGTSSGATPGIMYAYDTSTGNAVSTFGPPDGTPPPSDIGYCPQGIAVSPLDDNIYAAMYSYVSSTWDTRIRSYNPTTGAFVSDVFTQNDSAYLARGIAFDASGNLYAALNNKYIAKRDATSGTWDYAWGDLTTIAYAQGGYAYDLNVHDGYLYASVQGTGTGYTGEGRVIKYDLNGSTSVDPTLVTNDSTKIRVAGITFGPSPDGTSTVMYSTVADTSTNNPSSFGYWTTTTDPYDTYTSLHTVQYRPMGIAYADGHLYVNEGYKAGSYFQARLDRYELGDDNTWEEGWQTSGTTNYSTAGWVVNVVPEPSTLALLGCGLIGLLAYAWRKRK